MNTCLRAPQWAFDCGTPATKGVIRRQPDDFEVTEQLGYELSGMGEHLWLLVEKRNQNTGWVAEQLARYLGVQARHVGYAGLKDRHALTRQWFSAHLPGRDDPDLSGLHVDGIAILEQTRHHRKLRTGGLEGNRFRIVVRELNGDTAGTETRLQTIAVSGVPNYFGEQRFGRDGGNLDKALAMFRGDSRPRRSLQGIYLSAARSFLFNEVLSRRIEADTWLRPTAGDVMMLDGSHSVFKTKDESIDELMARLHAGDVHITGPLFGKGQSMVEDEVLELETTVFARHPEFIAGLEAAGLKPERRALRVIPGELQWQFEDDSLILNFTLPAGSYATAVLRELVLY
ncbi:MAG TPA: tRNA pseudouridine(13) synthase TruD [Gammaproteobacteria bacterium]